MAENLASGQRRALGLLNALAWIRHQGMLRGLYRRIPQAWRDKVSRLLDRTARRQLCFPRNANWHCEVPSAALERPAATASVVGINVFGYLSGEFGLAESARLYSRALLDARAPAAFFNIDLALPHGMKDHSFARLIGENTPHEVNLMFINPDFLDPAMAVIGHARFEGKPRVACWFWELPQIPGEWLPAIQNVDAILVASAFVEDAFRKVTDKPIIRVPLPYYPSVDSGLTRRDFGLEEGVYQFLCMFDFHSSMARKNPLAVIDAFKRAFPTRADVRLLIKSSNGHFHQQALRELLAQTANDVRVVVRDDIIEKAHVQSLLRCCDAFVSLHRAEGFGLVMAEAMGLGKPVIATRWSGNLEFMTRDNSCLVDFELRPVRTGEYPHVPGDVWAEPDVDDAARHMKYLVEDREWAAGLGKSARESLLAQLDPYAIGMQLAEKMASVKALHAGSTT